MYELGRRTVYGSPAAATACSPASAHRPKAKPGSKSAPSVERKTTCWTPLATALSSSRVVAGRG